MNALRIVTLLLLALCAAACGSRREDARTRSLDGPAATVAGTVLDAANGAPLAGVRIEGPHDTRAVSGRDGRFELTGLQAGTSGELVVRLSGERTVRRPLRKLSPGTLEVVIHVPR